MFKGNLYFPLPLTTAVDLFTDFDRAVANGFFSNPDATGGQLFCFHEEADAVAAGRAIFAQTAQPMPGARKEVPVFAVIHIGPITPIILGRETGSEQSVQIGPHNATVLVIEREGVERIAKIVRNGSVAWNRVDMTMKVFPAAA